MEDKIISLYNELLSSGIDESSYYKLIEFMDSMKINRDNLEIPLFTKGIVKFPTYIYRDGYEIDCD